MGVDQAGCREQAAAVDHPVGCRRCPVVRYTAVRLIVRATARVTIATHRNDASIRDEDVAPFDETFMPVQCKDRDVSNQQ